MASDPFLPLLFIILACFYLVAPWLISLNTRINSQTRVELIDGALYPLPVGFRERIDRDGARLRSLGFTFYQAYLVHLMKGNIETISFVYVNEQTHTTAAVTGTLFARGQGFRLMEMFTVMATAFDSPGRPILQTCTQDPVLNWGLLPQDVVYFFPHIKDVGRLLTLHEHAALVDFAGLDEDRKSKPASAEEFQKLVEDRYRALVQHWFETGRIHRTQNDAEYCIPIWTIYRVCWSKWLPFGPICKWMRYQRGRQLEKKLLVGP